MCAECGFALFCWNMHGCLWNRSWSLKSSICNPISQPVLFSINGAITGLQVAFAKRQNLTFGFVAGNSLCGSFHLYFKRQNVIIKVSKIFRWSEVDEEYKQWMNDRLFVSALNRQEGFCKEMWVKRTNLWSAPFIFLFTCKKSTLSCTLLLSLSLWIIEFQSHSRLRKRAHK